MTRRIAYLLSLLVFITGCSPQTATNAERGIAEKTLYIGNGSEPVSLDPHISTGLPEYHIQLAIFEGLVTKNNKTLAIEPAVAKSWTISDDGLTYTFTLREDARWSDGAAVTAQDFVNAWRRALTPAMASQYGYMFYYLDNAERYFNGEVKDFNQVGVKALADRVLEVTLEHPTPFFLQLLDHHSYYPVNKTVVEAHGEFADPLNPWTRPENFVGNGPFVLDVWDVNRAIEVVRNRHYWDQARIKLERIVFYPIEEKAAEDRAYRAGQIHMTHTPQFATEKIAHYRAQNPDAIRIIPTYSSYYYLFNTSRKPYSDPRVRKAVAMAIDRETLVESVMKGGEPPAYSIVPNDPQGYTPKQHFTFDIDAARALLADAGYPNGEGFPTMELLYNNDDVHRKVALALQQMLKRHLNINVQLLNQEWKVYLSSRKTLNYDFARAGWVADYLDPSNFLGVFYSFSGNNHTGWKNAQYDALLKKSRQTADARERFALFARADEILAAEMPVVPLFYYTDINLVSPAVRGWYDNVMNYNNFKDVELVPIQKRAPTAP